MAAPPSAMVTVTGPEVDATWMASEPESVAVAVVLATFTAPEVLET